LQVDHAVSHSGRNSPRYVPLFSPLILAFLIGLIRTLYTFLNQCYAATDNPKECSPQAEDYLECLHHTKEACWECAHPIFPFDHGSIADCTREGYQGGVCQEGTTPSCRGQKDCGCVGRRCYNGGRSDSKRWGHWVETFKGTIE
jgi:hypothetical protein